MVDSRVLHFTASDEMWVETVLTTHVNLTVCQLIILEQHTIQQQNAL